MKLTSENMREAIMTFWGPKRFWELAAEMKCSPRTVSRWAHGLAEPQPHQIGRLRRAIETKMEAVSGVIQRLNAA